MINAVVLAGKKYRIADNKSKATLEFGGKRCIETVVNALDKAKNINNVLIVGDVKDLGKTINGHTVIQERKRFFQNARLGYFESNIGKEDPLFFIHSDLPFVSSNAIDDFLDECNLDGGADLNLCLVDIEQIKKTFPGYKDYYPYTRLDDFGCRMGNCFLVYPGQISGSEFNKKYHIFKNAYDGRRFDEFGSLVRFVYNTGPLFLYSLLSEGLNDSDFYRGLLRNELCFNTSCEDFEKLLFRRTKLEFKFIKSSYPELAVDVDTQSDKDYVGEYIGTT